MYGELIKLECYWQGFFEKTKTKKTTKNKKNMNKNWLAKICKKKLQFEVKKNTKRPSMTRNVLQK